MPRKEFKFIFICEHSFPSGGAQSKRVSNFIAGIGKLSVDTAVIANSYNANSNYELHKGHLKRKKFEEVAGYPQSNRGIPLQIFSGSFFSIKVFFALLRRNQSYKKTIIYNSSASPLTLLILYLISIIKNYRIITDVGEWFPCKLSNSFKKSLDYIRHYIYRSLAIVLTDHILAISRLIQLKCGYFVYKSIVIPAIAIYPDERVDVAFKKNRLDYLLYAGTLKSEDGVEFLLKALYLLSSKGRGLKLITIGNFSNEDLIDLCTRVDIPHEFLSTYVKHMGWVSDEEYNLYLEECALFVIPRPNAWISNHASFPTRLADAMSLATPIAIANVGDIPHYLSPNVDFLSLKSGGTDDIYTSLKAWHDSPSEFLFIGKNGFENSRCWFDNVINCKKLIEYLDK